MKQYIWIKVVLVISNIVYGIKAAIWCGISGIYLLNGLLGMIRQGLGDNEFYMLLAGILIFVVSGAIPALMSVGYSMVVTSKSKKWIETNLKKCKVSLFVDCCTKVLMFLIECCVLMQIIMEGLEETFPPQMWVVNIAVILLVIYAVLFVLNFISLFLIKKIAHKREDAK